MASRSFLAAGFELTEGVAESDDRGGLPRHIRSEPHARVLAARTLEARQQQRLDVVGRLLLCRGLRQLGKSSRLVRGVLGKYNERGALARHHAAIGGATLPA
jgi:hypothetical protein